MRRAIFTVAIGAPAGMLIAAVLLWWLIQRSEYLEVSW